MAVRAVVGGDARVVQQRRARRVRRRRGSPAAPGRLAARQQLVLPDGQRRGARPRPRTAAARRSSCGSAEADGRAGPCTCRPSPGSSSHRRSVPGPDGLEHELAGGRRPRRRRRTREGARQERAARRRPRPTARPRRACRTARRAARARRGPRRRARRRRRRAALGDGQRAPAEGRQRARLAVTRRPRPARGRRGSPAARAPPRSPWRAGGDRARGGQAAGERGQARDAARDGGAADLLSRPSARPSRSAC